MPVALPGVFELINYFYDGLLSIWIWIKEGGRFKSPTPFPLVLAGLIQLALAIEHVPKPRVNESLAAEYLAVIPGALIVFVAVSAKQVFKCFSVKVMDSLTA